MSAYILAVAGAVLLSAALSVILPGGKMGAFLKGMSRLVVFAVLAAPLVSAITKRDLSLQSAELGEDSGYLAECARLLSERDEAEIAIFLQTEYSLAASASVTREPTGGFPLAKIRINLPADGISGQEAHIDISDCIRAALAGKYVCKEELIEVVWEE